MLQTEEIILCIDSRLRKFISDVRFRLSDEAILLYVSREKISDKVKPGFTSERQMKKLCERLNEKFSKNVEVIFTLWETHQDLENAFHQMLNHHFDGKILSFYMSFTNEKNVNAWIELIDLDNVLKEDVEQHFIGMLEDSELVSGFIQWIDSTCDLPTLPWILRFLKKRQPINLGGFLREVCVEFPVISDKWLNHKLDQLRKKGLIIREKSGNYVLTSNALSIVPAGAKSTSSDIDRALALGRRKWSN